jgi:hypothetical protein
MPAMATLLRQIPRPMKLSDPNFSAWHMFGFVLTAITVVLAAGWVIQGSELARDGLAFLSWQFACFIPPVGGVVAYMARRVWLAGRVTRHSMEPEGHILLAPLAVIAIGGLLAYSGWAGETRFALSRGAFERAVQSGEIFEPESGERWIGLYKVHSIHIDSLGRTAFNLGDCSMFAHCELEFDATTPCESRGRRSQWAVDTQWCVVIYDHF